MPSNRQWALLIWAAIAFIWALTNPKVRRSLASVARTVLAPRFLVILAGYLAMVIIVIYAANWVGLWDRSLMSDTLTWLFISGGAVWASFAKVGSEPDFFRTHLRQIIGLSLLIEFVLDFAVLPLVFELVLLPLLAVTAAVQAYASSDDKYAAVVRLASGCLVVAGLVLAVFGVASLVIGLADLEWADAGRRLVLPAWLTVAVLPYVYLLGVYAVYESTLRTISWRSGQGRRQRVVVRLALVTSYELRGHDLGQHGPLLARRLGTATTWTDAKAVIHDEQRDAETRRREEERLARRLVDYADVDGVDRDGRKLDQREFDETKSALYWLHTCHSGWWRKQERYHIGLLDIIGSPRQAHSLDPANGYHEWVAPDGSAWFGWRTTISGWVFGIGANGPPPEQWTYDGPEVPSGPPRVDPLWGDHPFDDRAGPNW